MAQRFYPQVVRMTRCERTTGHPELLREMVTFVGFRWAPEYQVFEYQREFEQTFYRAVVYIVSDDGSRVVHESEAVGTTVDMAVQQAAYVCLTILRADYWAFDDSCFRHIPRGYITCEGKHFTMYDNLEVSEKDSSRLGYTSRFGLHQDAVAQALMQELTAVREQLHQALTSLATYTTEFVGDERFARFQLPVESRLPDAGGYEPDRGPLLNLGAGYTGLPRFGAQDYDAYHFVTPRIPLRAEPMYVDRRYTYFRERTSRRRPA